jgi:hypothetical protein
MNSITNPHSNDSTTSLARRLVDGLLGTLAIVALVAAFAIEFAPISPDVQQGAQRLLHGARSATVPV